MRAAPALIALFFLCALSRGQNLRLTSGPVAHQVLQRGAANSADVRMEGVATGAQGRTVEARLLAKGLELDGFAWSPISRVANGQWDGALKDIPAGGPYRLELRMAGSQESVAIEDLLVGDLWVLGGQSNMEGCGNLENLETPHPLVHSFDLTDTWLLAQDPLHRLIDAVDPVHRDGKPRPTGEELQRSVGRIWRGAGLGLPFAIEMVRRTGVPIGLIPCAHGGSSMDQWEPRLKDKGGDSLYGSMLRRVRSAGGKVTGMLWYQGESDASPEAVSTFQPKFENFISAVRADVGDPQLPFYYVQIGRFVATETRRLDEAWNQVQDLQRKAEMNLRRSGMVAAVDAELDDIIHLNTVGLKRVGRRLANLACRDLFPEVASCRQLKPGPRPVSITMEKHAIRDEYLMRVRFSGVNGGLKSEGRIAGFSVHAPDGTAMPVIFKAAIDPTDAATVLLSLHVRYSFGTAELPRGATLRYGYGKDPYCNVADEADMAVPVFSMAIP